MFDSPTLNISISSYAANNECPINCPKGNTFFGKIIVGPEAEALVNIYPSYLITLAVDAMLSEKLRDDRSFQRYGYKLLTNVMNQSDVEIGNRGIEALAHSFNYVPRVEILVIRGYSIDGEGMKALVGRLPTSLKKVQISSTSMGDIGTLAVLNAAKHLPKLEILILPQNEISDLGVAALSCLMSSAQNLKMVDFSNNNIGDLGAFTLAYYGMENR